MANSPVEIYTCDNTDCDFNQEDRRWQVYKNLAPVTVVDEYDESGNLTRRSHQKGEIPSQRARSKCPSCGEFGKKMAVEESRNIMTGEIGGLA